MNDQQYYKAKLKEAVEGILSGKLKHNQKLFHCGSAHCVIGWYEMLTLDKNESADDFTFFGHIKRLSTAKNLYDQISKETGYSRENLVELADTNNTKEDIKRIWERMNHE